MYSFAIFIILLGINSMMSLQGLHMKIFKKLKTSNYLVSTEKAVIDAIDKSDNILLQNSWVSGLSTNVNLELAIEEVLNQAFPEQIPTTYSIALFFVSSIYETIGFSSEIIYNLLKSKIPGLKTVIGSTSGAVIGPLDPRSSLEPSEIEGRASLGISFINSEGISHSTLSLSLDEINKYNSFFSLL